MGWCHEFGAQVGEGCGHPMTAGASSCHCATCGTVCEGRFTGCPVVWERGPRDVLLPRPPAERERERALGARAALPPAPSPNGRHPEATGPGPADHVASLRAAVEGLRGEVAVLAEAVRAQGVALARLVEVDRSARPDGREASQARAGTGPDGGPTADEVRRSLAEARAAAAELRRETVRLAAFREALADDHPSLAGAVGEATARAEQRLAALGETWSVAPPTA